MSNSPIAYYHRALYYILTTDRRVQPAIFAVWSRWMAGHLALRRVGYDTYGDTIIETYFSGIDLATVASSHLVVFETVMHTGDGKKVLDRYGTYAEAEAGHRRWTATLQPEEGGHARSAGN
jgi:hypothetical protein